MYHPTQAIVLSAIKYGENSRVLKCFTREFGLQAYMVNGLSSKKGVVKTGMILPLSQLDLLVTHKGKGTLERIKEARVLMPYTKLHTDPVRNALALFIAELLTRAIREEGPNPEKFHFIQERCYALDGLEVVPPHFHIAFMLGLTHFLGFYPDARLTLADAYFDLMEGNFLLSQPLHPYYMDKQTTAALQVLLKKEEEARISKPIRRKLLYDLLQYYRIHIAEFGELKSVEILEALFSD